MESSFILNIIKTKHDFQSNPSTWIKDEWK